MRKIVFYTTLVVIALVSCKGNKTENGEKLFETDIENVSHFEIPELPETISSESMDDEVQVFTVKIGNDPDKSHLRASFPVTSYDFVNKEEKMFTQKFIDKFKDEYKKNIGQETSTSGLDFNQHFDVKFHNKDFLVFLHTQNVSYGNNYSDQNIASIYDLEKQKKLRTKELFKSEKSFEDFASEIKSIAREIIKEYIRKDTTYANDEEKEQIIKLSEEQIIEGTLATDENYDALFFDEKGDWHIIFDKYQIASGSMGEFPIKISENIVNKYIDERFINIFKKEEDSENSLSKEQVTPSLSEVDCSKVPCVALTFDDGPSVYTSELLDALKEENVKATFFVLGKSASIQKNTLKRMAEEGHNIGNHSYDHKDFRKISDEEALKQIRLTDEIVESITGEKPKYFRFPYGAHTDANLEMVGRPVIMWNVDPMDWKYREVGHVAEAMSKTAPQGIVLAHDIHKTTVQAIPQVIKNLKKQGYHIVSLDNLFRHKELKSGQKYANGK